MAEKLIRKYGAKLLKKKNVIGFEHKLQKRIRNGEEVDELCFVVYVTRKVSPFQLKYEDLIPAYLDDVPVDVIEIGKIEALLPRKKKTVNKRGTFRPLVAGISIGHTQITAGTLGWFVEGPIGEVFLASNAHVFTPDPSMPPARFTERRILQPGDHDGGTETVALYTWHEQIEPINTCKFAQKVVDSLNWLSKAFGRKSRFELQQPVNHIDFAVAVPIVAYKTKFVDTDELPDPFVGFGFAGSNVTGVVCKIQHIIAQGFKPVGVDICNDLVSRVDIVRKTGRTSCLSSAKVIGTSATVRVSYGNFEALFTDVILTEKLLEPGDSGSAVWKVIE
ncbi:MAG: hypothetical protein ACTSPB_16475 [Candidatus Thorarchaeota archaeon]